MSIYLCIRASYIFLNSRNTSKSLRFFAMSIIETSSNYYTLSPEAPLAQEIGKSYRWYSQKFAPHVVPRFADVSSITENPGVMRAIRDFFVQRYKSLPDPITHVMGFDARGFLFGPLIAVELGVPFVLMRKAGKNAGLLIKSEPYEKEYKEETEEVMTIRHGSINKGSRVLLVDDVLATGGTALAGLQLVEASGATSVEMAFVMNITPLSGAKNIHNYKDGRFKNVKVFSLVESTCLDDSNCGDVVDYDGPRVISCECALNKL